MTVKLQQLENQLFLSAADRQEGVRRGGRGVGEESEQHHAGDADMKRCVVAFFLPPLTGSKAGAALPDYTAMSYISQNSFARPPDCMNPVTVKLFY